MIGAVVVFVICVAGIVLTFLGCSIHFQDYEYLFILPTIVLLIAWFFGVIRYVKNNKKEKTTKAIAIPNNSSNDFDKTELRNIASRTKTRTLLSSCIVLLFFILITWDRYNAHGHEHENIDKQSIRNIITPELKALVTKVDKYFEINGSYGLNGAPDSEWHSIFSGHFKCFANEYKAQQEYLNSYAYMFDLKSYNNEIGNLTFQLDVYEMMIYDSNMKHYKLRYNPQKIIKPKFINFSTNAVIYDINSESFTTSYNDVNKYYPIKTTYCDANEWNISSDIGFFVYDSKTKTFRFEYDNAWENFLEHYKIVFFIILYMLTFALAYLLIKFAKIYALMDHKPYKKTLHQLTWD